LYPPIQPLKKKNIPILIKKYIRARRGNINFQPTNGFYQSCERN
jgi:hypothetical protein